MTSDKAANGWVTMQDVAREAGVSAMTVSRVLKVPAKVAPPTRHRVEAAIARLGYVPDSVAGALSSGRSRLVAAILSTLGGSIFVSTVAGLGETLRARGHQLLLGTTDYSQESEEALLAATLGRRPDGLVLTSGVHTEDARAMLGHAAIPVVELWELPETPIDMAVGFSNHAAGQAMTRFLFELGYRRIAFLGALGPEDRRGRARFDGYAEAVTELGIGPTREIGLGAPTSPIEHGARSLPMLLERWPECDAVFCASDAMALGVFMEAMRRGVAVPGQLAIAGLGDFEYAGDHGLGLTTLAIPGERMGREAARLLLARKDGAAPPGTVVDVGFEPVRRATA